MTGTPRRNVHEKTSKKLFYILSKEFGDCSGHDVVCLAKTTCLDGVIPPKVVSSLKGSLSQEHCGHGGGDGESHHDNRSLDPYPIKCGVPH